MLWIHFFSCFTSSFLCSTFNPLRRLRFPRCSIFIFAPHSLSRFSCFSSGVLYFVSLRFFCFSPATFFFSSGSFLFSPMLRVVCCFSFFDKRIKIHEAKTEYSKRNEHSNSIEENRPRPKEFAKRFKTDPLGDRLKWSRAFWKLFRFIFHVKTRSKTFYYRSNGARSRKDGCGTT